jgi:holo-[acyl-carrier protein] synthase
MIIGIGTDILKIERIQNMFEGSDDPFLRSTYTEKEQIEAAERHNPVLYFATRFAGKEAVFKSLSIEGKDIRLNEIEILGSITGQPNVTLSGRVKTIAEEKSIKNVLVTLSYDDEYVVGFAIAQD